MIEIKNCKSQTKAKGYEGCNNPTNVKYRKFGLCPSCFYDWMKTTEAGKIYHAKQFLPKVSKKINQNNREEKRESQIDLMTADKYRAKYLQPIINEIARLIDYGCPCIATGSFEGKMNGGHYTSVGSNRTIALNIHNIHVQSFHSNTWNGGDDKKYQEGLINVYGQPYLDFISGLKRHRPIKISKKDLRMVYKKALELRNDLRSNLQYLEPMKRITLRNSVNIHLGIYDSEFSIFSNKKLLK